MKTTLNLNDQVLRQAKSRAAREGITLSRFVEDAVRARLAAVRDGKTPFRMRLITVKGDRLLLSFHLRVAPARSRE